MIPKYLKIQNFLSHDVSEIDFDRFDVALILGTYDSDPDQSNGSGKCLWKDTILTDAITGERITIENLVKNNRRDFHVYGLDEDLKLRPTKIIAGKYSGKKKLLKITLQNGMSEIVSDTHPIFTGQLKTVQAQHLSVGDFIGQPRHMFPKETKNNLTEKEARILALYIAEGGLTNNKLTFTNTDKNIIKVARDDIGNVFGAELSKHKITYTARNKKDRTDIRRKIINRLIEIDYPIKKELGKNFHRAMRLESGIGYKKLLDINDKIIEDLTKQYHASKYLKKFLIDYDSYGKKSINKELPNILFSQPNNIVATFLGMFISCDGYISDVTKNNKREISIGLGSEKLIDGLHCLLQQRGIISLKRKKIINKKFDSWILTISQHKDNLMKFYNFINGYVIGEKSKKLDKIIEICSNKQPNPNVDLIPQNILYECVVNANLPHIKKNKGINLTLNQIKNKCVGRDKAKKYAEYFNDKILNNIANSDILWSKIKKIEKLIEDETYDIQVDNETNLYALNGFITHNSCIFESITWALFGKSRHKKMDGVVKSDRRACRVEFTFWANDILYKIIRTRDKIIGESDVVFEQHDGSSFISISCDTNSATNKKIIHTINVNYDVFVNSVYFKQDDISMFATSTPSKRKDIIKALLKMGQWDTYQKKAKERVKRLETRIEEKSKQMVPMIELDKELDECRISLNDIKKAIKGLNKLYTQMNTDLITKKSSYSSLYNSNDNSQKKLVELKKEYADASRKMKEINSELNKNNQIISNNSNKISGLQQNIKVYKEQIKNKKAINIEFFRSKIIEGRTAEKVLLEQVENLKKDVKLANKCDLCKTPLTKAKIDVLKKQRAEELATTKDKYERIKLKVIKATKSLQNKEKIVDAGTKAEIDKGKAENKIAKLKNEIDSCISINNRLTEDKKNFKNRNFEKEISYLEDKLDQKKKESLKNDISVLEKSISDTKKNSDKLNVEYGGKVRRRDEISTLQAEQDYLQKEVNKLKSELVVYDKLKDYFGKDGIQAIIIENVIEELENYSNETLAKICNEPTSISIKTQKQNDNGSWAETFDILIKSGSRTDDFDTYSGGERFRVSLALRLALSNVLSNRMGGEIKFLLLDEVSSNLDNKGLSMFIDIIKSLSEDIKILVITHNERLKEKFEDIIMIDKGLNGSTATMN